MSVLLLGGLYTKREEIQGLRSKGWPVPPIVHDAEHGEGFAHHTIDHVMLPDGMNARRWGDLRAFAGDGRQVTKHLG
ncbi:hypothetical protein TK43_03195 [Roseovarius sp. JS7-11]|nr:hypothetical protein TK43_03195 [Roseovarius sp. JS7-11]